MKKIKLFAIGILANTMENIILLYYFKINFDQTVFISALIFALASFSIYKLAENSHKEKNETN